MNFDDINQSGFGCEIVADSFVLFSNWWNCFNNKYTLWFVSAAVKRKINYDFFKKKKDNLKRISLFINKYDFQYVKSVQVKMLWNSHDSLLFRQKSSFKSWLCISPNFYGLIPNQMLIRGNKAHQWMHKCVWMLGSGK